MHLHCLIVIFIPSYYYIYNEKRVYFWPSNFWRSPRMTIELQNHVSLAIQLLKPFIFDHRTIFGGWFADVDTRWWRGRGAATRMRVGEAAAELLSRAPARPLRAARTRRRGRRGAALARTRKATASCTRPRIAAGHSELHARTSEAAAELLSRAPARPWRAARAPVGPRQSCSLTHAPARPRRVARARR
jgi:hypothetical protein